MRDFRPIKRLLTIKNDALNMNCYYVVTDVTDVTHVTPISYIAPLFAIILTFVDMCSLFYHYLYDYIYIVTIGNRVTE